MEISDEFAHAIFRNSIFQDTLAQSIKKTIAAVPKQE